MSNVWVQSSTIYLAGITGIWKGIPVGFALEAPPILTGLFTALGSITVVLILLFAGKPFKDWLLRRYGQKGLERKQGRMRRLMDRYGVAGVGLIASGLIGPTLSTLLGLALVQQTRRLMIFLITGVILWSTLITLMAMYSLELVLQLIG